MKYTENAINILTAKAFKGIGRAWIINNLNEGADDIDKVVNLLNKTRKKDIPEITYSDFEEKRDQILRAMNNSSEYMDGVVAIGDKNFPICRGDVKSSERPIFLFYKGDLSLLEVSNNNVAVIGLLNPDNSIINSERDVVKYLIKKQSTIVSGLALGCDTIAHQAALDFNGKTIAILPSPLKSILPASNKELADKIIKQGGLVITEYLTDAKSKMELGGRYQDRDRLQALFSDCIILTASYAKDDKGFDSGSRLAMEYARNYSIPRAVIYNANKNNNDSQYNLNRQCIAEQNTIIIIDQDHIDSAIAKIVKKRYNRPKDLFDTLF